MTLPKPVDRRDDSLEALLGESDHKCGRCSNNPWRMTSNIPCPNDPKYRRKP